MGQMGRCKGSEGIGIIWIIRRPRDHLDHLDHLDHRIDQMAPPSSFRFEFLPGGNIGTLSDRMAEVDDLRRDVMNH